MADKTFVYWTTKGERREVPITNFSRPEGVSLRLAHKCQSARTLGIANPLSSDMSALDRPLALGPQRTG
jgi:hypothetical protein